MQIFFGELDYQQLESNGAFKVVVTKVGLLRSALFLTITPLTFEEFRQGGYRLPNEEVFDELNTIDPAECKPSGGIKSVHAYLVLSIFMHILVICTFVHCLAYDKN